MTNLSFRALIFASALILPLAARAQDAAHGKEVYLKYTCYACHGFSGQNGPGAHLVPMKMAQGAFTAYVRSPGSTRMPTYSAKVLSDADLGAVWAYIKTLPDSPPAKDIPLLKQIENEK
jgi:mono/diheme cytochrome c family protein